MAIVFEKKKEKILLMSHLAVIKDNVSNKATHFLTVSGQCSLMAAKDMILKMNILLEVVHESGFLVII